MSPKPQLIPHYADITTPIADALRLLESRQSDTRLRASVEEFLGDDVPEHFQKPILHLARHIATPNFETLRFIEVAQPYGLPLVVGEDLDDIFVSNNSLKRALGKLSVIKGVTRSFDEIIQHFTVIDFPSSQGKKLRDIHTTLGSSLKEFHADLFRTVYPTQVSLIDESSWITRHHRGNIFEHYKRLLALFIVHGVMFENYEPEDAVFVETVLKPAFNATKEMFGVKPLICNILTAEEQPLRDWNSYPSVLHRQIENMF